MNNKAIFIGGVGRSGTTLVKELLNKHHEIAAFGETKLVNEKFFLNFPFLVYKYPLHLRTYLLTIYEQLCTTYLYCRLAFPRTRHLRERCWLYYEKLWPLRLQFPKFFMFNNFVWHMLEKAWLPELLQKFISGQKTSAHIRGFPARGWRGLYEIFEKKDIKQCFAHLAPLANVATLDEAYRVYGEFWNCVFSTYVQKQKKKYWAEKTPGNAFHALFLKQCFSNLKFINLVRDGRDAACSAKEFWGTDMKRYLDEWAFNLVTTMRDQEKIPKNYYLNIRYEDLVSDTQTTLKKITDFLEVDFDTNMLSSPVSSASVGRYKHEFDPNLKDYAKYKYGFLLTQWGYYTYEN